MGMNAIKRKTGLINAVYLTIAFIFLMPVIKTILLSVAKPSEAAGYFALRALPAFPRSISVEQYYDLLVQNAFYLRMFWLTLLIGLLIAIFNVLISLMSAYVLAKIPFRYATAFIFIYILAMMMPFQITLLPNYLLVKWLGLYDTIFALILPGIFNPFGTFFLVQIVKTIPQETIDAAHIDSGNIFQTLLFVVVPQIKAGLVALFIISFSEAWNMVEPVLILTKGMELRTLGTAFNDMFTYNNAIAFAGCVVYMLPIIFLYLLFDQEICDGFSAMKLDGASKK